LNLPVIVRLKDGRELVGTLVGYDVHINLVLKDAYHGHEKIGDVCRTKN